jgi:hypothetical protein
MAAWLVDDRDQRRSEPQVIHGGGRCGHARRESVGQLPRGFGINDMPVRYYRRSPLQAVADGLRSIERGGDVDEWTRWIGVVLGLPGGVSLTEMAMADSAGDDLAIAVIERV